MPTLDPSAPVSSLLTAAELSQSELARRLDGYQGAVGNAIARGDAVSLRWLLRAAEACGFSLEIRAVPKNRQGSRKKVA
jgi:hypothetical protein